MLAEKRQHHKAIGLQPRLLAHGLRLCKIDLGQRLVASVEVERGEAVVAGEQELWLFSPLRETERFVESCEGQRVFASALVNLAQHDQGHSQVVKQPEPTVEID